MEKITNYSDKTISYKYIYRTNSCEGFFNPKEHFTPTLADVVYLGPYATFTTLDMLYIFDADEFRAATAKPETKETKETTTYIVQYKDKITIRWTDKLYQPDFNNESDARDYIQKEIDCELKHTQANNTKWSILKRTEERILS